MPNSKTAKPDKIAAQVLQRLQQAYPDAGPRLRFNNPYQSLVAFMLSAQTTDNQVNRVTPALFGRYPVPQSLAEADVEEVAGLIRSVGLYQTKAKHLVAAASLIMQQYGGTIPDTLEALLALPGVGRKTANVLLANAFGKPGLGVDTHVHRVANRLGLAAAKLPESTELQLKMLIPEQKWGLAHHLLIFHGRRVCKARMPDCPSCILGDLCLYRHSQK
ncbi:MAG: endonuclease III [Thermacetogeniaceae bacterium]